MTKLPLFVAVLLGLAKFGAGPVWAEVPELSPKVPVTLSGVVVRVADGDTLTIRPHDQSVQGNIRVRFIAIDTPESHFRSARGKIVNQNPWGEDAHRALLKMVPVGSKVTVKSFGQDAYGRTLGRVLVGRSDVNLSQVASGMASMFFICGNNCDATYLKQLNFEGYRRACKKAQREGRGIYNPSNPLKELPFEFRAREGETELKRPVGDWTTKRLYSAKDYHRVHECDRLFFSTEADARRMGFTYR